MCDENVKGRLSHQKQFVNPHGVYSESVNLKVVFSNILKAKLGMLEMLVFIVHPNKIILSSLQLTVTLKVPCSHYLYLLKLIFDHQNYIFKRFFPWKKNLHALKYSSLNVTTPLPHCGFMNMEMSPASTYSHQLCIP